MGLDYKKYNDKKIVVRGDKEKYNNLIKKINGRWFHNLKGGAGWLVPIENEKHIQKLNTLISTSATTKSTDEDDELEITNSVKSKFINVHDISSHNSIEEKNNNEIKSVDEVDFQEENQLLDEFGEDFDFEKEENNHDEEKQENQNESQNNEEDNFQSEKNDDEFSINDEEISFENFLKEKLENCEKKLQLCDSELKKIRSNFHNILKVELTEKNKKQYRNVLKMIYKRIIILINDIDNNEEE